MIVIDFLLVLKELLPPQHNLIEINDFMKPFMNSMTYNQNQFTMFFNKVKYDLSINGQVCYLELLLNNQFDPYNHIFITDAEVIESDYLFNQIELNEPFYLVNQTEPFNGASINNSSDFNQFDFIVNIPAALNVDLNLAKQLINKYKLASKRYKINLI